MPVQNKMIKSISGLKQNDYERSKIHKMINSDPIHDEVFLKNYFAIQYVKTQF